MKKDKEIIVDVLPGWDEKEGKMYHYGFKYSGKNRTVKQFNIWNPNKTRNKQGKRGDQNIYTDYTSPILSNGTKCVQKNNYDMEYWAAGQTFHKFEGGGYYNDRTFEGDNLL